MEKQPSESLKRTCLICGCHTNQTINIYEPRGGPNIVQLIQAKFKFQPLNEDKYLCYSCNNWLINWHSLQALNSNDAGSPSGTFRAQQLSGGAAGGASGGGAHNRDGNGAGLSGGGSAQHCPIAHNAGDGTGGGAGVFNSFGDKPVALVRPRQILGAHVENQRNIQSITSIRTTTAPLLPSIITKMAKTKPRATQVDVLKTKKIDCKAMEFSKVIALTQTTPPTTSNPTTAGTCIRLTGSLGRILRQRQRRQQLRQQQRQQCHMCDSSTAVGVATKTKCAKCQAIAKWRATIYERNLRQQPQQQQHQQHQHHHHHQRVVLMMSGKKMYKAEIAMRRRSRTKLVACRGTRGIEGSTALRLVNINQKPKLQQQQEAVQEKSPCKPEVAVLTPSLRLPPFSTTTVAATAATDRTAGTAPPPPTIEQRQHLPRPSVDGKVVAMLRRLGTTLSRENNNDSATTAYPYVMQQQQQHVTTRQLDDDEILLDFDTAISEVWPKLTDAFSNATIAATTTTAALDTANCAQSATLPSPTTNLIVPTITSTYQMTGDIAPPSLSTLTEDHPMDASSCVNSNNGSSGATISLPAFQSVFMPRGLIMSLI